jgi:hypothetical protein
VFVTDGELLTEITVRLALMCSELLHDSRVVSKTLHAKVSNSGCGCREGDEVHYFKRREIGAEREDVLISLEPMVSGQSVEVGAIIELARSFR